MRLSVLATGREGSTFAQQMRVCLSVWSTSAMAQHFWAGLSALRALWVAFMPIETVELPSHG